MSKELEPGRELDAIIAEKVMGLSVGWARFKYWHPHVAETKLDDPYWSLTAFPGIGLEQEKYTPQKNSDGKLIKSILADDFQEFGYLPTGQRILKFSTEISAAWNVVEKMYEKLGYHFCLSSYNGNKYWTAQFNKFELDVETHGIGSIDAPTAPHAICLAALKAIE